MTSPFGTVAAILKNKLTGASYAPSLFRVGMTVTMDPTPFILAAGATKVPVPQSDGGDLLVSVEAVGRLVDGSATLLRLYLPDGKGFFQLHLDASGHPDECRFFAPLDEVNPASPDEWAFWIDDDQGMIGWPEFQTKDGKIYRRAWAPGTTRIAPRDLAETRTDLRGDHAARYQSMLYAGPTGAAEPAPATEYILVSLVEADGQSWITIDAGIDVNPAALSLA